MKRISVLLGLMLLLAWSCKKEKIVEEEPTFDRGVMLKNYAENLIVPAYRDALTAVNQLISRIDAFTANSNLQNLESAQNAWISAYGEWQYASAFNIGPAAEQGLNKSLAEEVATFPVSETKINNALNNGQSNFNDFNRDARGFLAVEYLLFGGVDESNNDVLNLFNNQVYRKAFLKDCAQNIKTRIDNAAKQWDAAYVGNFVKNNGTDVGSSTSQLYNEFVKSFETNKNFKVELPMGMRPGQTQSVPELVEAYYSGQSLTFLKIHLTAIENIYFGKSKTGADGLGFKDYLETVTGGKELVASTTNQWTKVTSSVNAIPANLSLSQLIVSNHPSVNEFRMELQKHTRFFKSDMSSLLGIAITYSSGDGD
jgi:uncharacterized protein